MNPNYETELKQLRQKLANKNLSVLVGAGFSKNVHGKLFLSWRELLDKMVRKMNVRNYAAAYERQTGKKAKETDKKYQRFIEDQVNQYLEQTDYLQVVSNYIKKMGYRETVDVCIEESIPEAILKSGKIFLRSKENGKVLETEITHSDLIVHRKLTRLPWNNIYTTNYDNLLEVCINEDTISGLDKQIKEYERELQQLRESIHEKVIKADELSAQIRAEEETTVISPNTQIRTDGAGSDVFPLKRVNDRIRELSNQKNALNYQIISAEYQINDITKRKLKLEEALVDSYVVVKHSSQLAIKRNRNIIKLHGSLPSHDEDIFAFDNEYDKRYIISQEDYEYYPLRHEAFTQLMRISLLQGYFCLIGFSGDDPNFMAWISWVRSVIMRNAGKKHQEAKIYFLDARTSSAPDPHKMQFYKNHRISYIPLCHPDCITFLEKELQRTIIPTDTKSLLSNLMDYWADISIPDLSQISYEIMGREKYGQLWGKMVNRQTFSIDSHSVANAYQHYDELKILKRFNRIPQLGDLESHQKHRLLSHTSSYWSGKKLDVKAEAQLLGLIALALEDFFIPHSLVIEEAEFRRLFELAKNLSPELYRQYLKLDLKDAIWHADQARSQQLKERLKAANPDIGVDDIIHLFLMDAAVNFQFSELREILEQYEEPIQAATTLAGYWFYFVPDIGMKLLKNRQSELAQEQAYTLGMLRILSANDDSSKVNEKCQRLKQEGLSLLEDNQKHAISQLRAKTKFEPFADDAILGRSFSIDNSGRPLLGFQTLGMMLETGLPLSGNGYYFQDKHDMHPIFLQVFERYPLPVLFFSLQYTEKKYIKRLAQDFTFSKAVSSQSRKIFDFLSAACDDSQTPAWYKMSMLTFLSELIYILPPESWHSLLRKTWKEKLKENVLFNQDGIRDVDFIETGLRFCRDAEIMATVIADCLKAVIENSSMINSANRYLYRIANNPFHKTLKTGIKKKVDAGLIDKIIGMVAKQPDYLFIVGNLHSFLTVNQIKSLESKLTGIAYQAINFSNLWSVAVHYSGQRKATQQKIIDELLKSPMLWQTGISVDGNGAVSYRDTNNYISIRKLTRKKGNQGLAFSKSDIKKIYAKIKPRLQEIVNIRSVEHLWNEDCFDLLQEMSWFLEAEVDILKSESDYLQIKDEIIRLAFNNDRNLHILSGLTSGDNNLMNQAVTEIAVSLYDREEFEGQNVNIKLIINKVLLKTGVGIVLCLEYLVAWCKYFKDTKQLKLYEHDLLRILITYKEEYPLGLQVPRLEELLVELALVLRFWGHENEATSYFLDKLNSSCFNNVRYNLSEKVKQRKGHQI